MRIEEIPAKPKEQKIIRVAAYARVSSDKDAAFHSLEAQTEYYRDYAAAHPEWELVSIYSDNGISGTTINRPEFQRMLQDCREGKIDLVVTKSVTRFARNTVILLETIRELKKLGIDCYFEKEDMHSISPDGELLLTLLAMYAEEEARSASENQKWRIQKPYDQGKPAGGHIFGYRLVEEKFEIVPEEAEVVKEIFRLYLSGMGYGRIARTLIERSVPARFGGTWSSTSIRDILVNEKYAGDLLLQKFFHEDFRTKKKRKNTGELRKVYVKNSHDAIIDQQTFKAVQQEIQRRSLRQVEIMAHRNTAHDNNKLFTGLISCSCCGGTYVRKYTNAKSSDQPIWICGQYTRYGKSVCQSQRIPEAILIEKTKAVLNLSELSQAILQDHISHIIVPEHNHLIYELKDGSSVDVFWDYPSRSLSWTEEMRETARQKALRQHRKEEKPKMPEIEIIAATKTLQQQPLSSTARKSRVAAYARVSTEQDEQQSSYEAQVDFYTRYIKSNPDWEFVGVFADRGITGTNTKNRESFNRMIDLALSGGIDIILTKSISRFARNTVDTLQTVRELKAVGVEVRFEKENLHTFDPKCEMMLTIMSSLTQEESRSISENVRWGKQKSMRDGKVTLAYSHFLGYKKGKDGRPEIVEEEAVIIRQIYDLFLKGKTINEIAAILTKMRVPTPTGKTKWSVSTVKSILSNEKYKGEALLQKTYTVDYLTKEVRKNNGEVASVRVYNSHDPIIEPEVFDRVQEMLAEYTKRRAKVRTKHPFAGKLICGNCGEFYGHKVWRLRSTGEHYDVWYCNHKYDGDEVCDSPRLRETEVKEAFGKMLQKCGDPNPVYTDERWSELVESVKVCRGNHLIFTLTSGEIVKITL